MCYRSPPTTWIFCLTQGTGLAQSNSSTRNIHLTCLKTSFLPSPFLSVSLCVSLSICLFLSSLSLPYSLSLSLSSFLSLSFSLFLSLSPLLSLPFSLFLSLSLPHSVSLQHLITHLNANSGPES